MQPSIDGRNTRASPDYSALWDVGIILGDRSTAPQTLPRFQRNIKKNVKLAEFAAINGRGEKHANW
ncbi:MAG: hypothetical protein JGK26_14620 [Microcoleus sp. PH2017_27_LUM_O_A]|uniref:hypothetical protein n=1 Tax=unclassified Microcoleus TaxID=2642155 RepID=UPI001D77EAB0|nr:MULTISPECIES: hypothetical protein [unclassified Microcoleus]MCC3526802.1 hypothetical protein [Microcoleus sp. PH2017_21_RUC_O_A]TAF00170.1 MAG: hypothetical protein EAZ79_03845 [Oscillatoriales cyanobacterium]MCC3460971.1 hypothetical protein [Microcoleus sp. PH2017_11_PCY_U_A]MCC3479492.1 hypothetical protein [Microcoleus sp. PH2017_12_PCY_D_A]MCC3539007.1 hypothetical protein [Microcoleus sp. PH2017_22_RUC_O_B]